MSEQYLGVMSGTSFDGVDTILAEFDGKQIRILEHHETPMPKDLREALLQLSQTDAPLLLQTIYALDARLGEFYANAIENMLTAKNIDKQTITAIGCHGQTIRHFPNASPPFTVQLGDPNIIAARTNITTVADFRRRDLALGGQGAPLAPAFHQHFLSDENENRAILNLGGFANVTLLPCSGNIKGFDTGPGNVLLDAWCEKHLHKAFDENGDWASSGTVNETLLEALLAHPFFKKQPPKSTGRDEINLAWVEEVLAGLNETISDKDVQATLTELTAISVSDAIQAHQPDTQTIYVCGGGAYNTYLLKRLSHHLPKLNIQTTETLNISPKHIEPALMAWLAYRTLNKQPIDLRHITGSEREVLLGGVYYS